MMRRYIKGELVRYSTFEYPFRIKALEGGNVAWIVETYATKYVAGGRVARVMRVPISQLQPV